MKDPKEDLGLLCEKPLCKKKTLHRALKYDMFIILKMLVFTIKVSPEFARGSLNNKQSLPLRYVTTDTNDIFQ